LRCHDRTNDYPSLKHITQDNIEQVKDRSHEEGSSHIFMLYDMQFEGGVWKLSSLKQKKTENYHAKVNKIRNYQENKHWFQVNIYQQKSELITETLHQFYILNIYPFLTLVN
jgi:hypothetical protein